MAQRECERVGDIGRLGLGGQPQLSLHHALHLLLRRGAVAGDGLLHLVRRVLHDLRAGGARGRQHQPARLTHRHRGAGVGLEEQALDRDRVGPQLGEKAAQLGIEGRQPAGQLVGAGVVTTPIATTDSSPLPLPLPFSEPIEPGPSLEMPSLEMQP